MQNEKSIIDNLVLGREVERSELRTLLSSTDKEIDSYLAEQARSVCTRHYAHKVYIRGLIEISNFCKNDCYYCGIRHSNRHAQRYRLTAEEIRSCCDYGYHLGFRTFVLQGGEDPLLTDERLEKLIGEIKQDFPDCALTLSLGERSYESYQRLFVAGADRYLLRHETVNFEHYAELHPANLSAANRQQCIRNLQKIGYQTGCGIMVGSPGQSTEHLIDDLLYMQQLQPHMVGIGPFIPHQRTPFAAYPAGSLDLTLRVLAITRLLLPEVLLPATTALGTVASDGRKRGILAGCNVIMPNLTPPSVREKYLLYDNKVHSGSETAEALDELRAEIAEIGYTIVIDRGDHPKRTEG